MTAPCTCKADWGRFEPTCSDYSRCSGNADMIALLRRVDEAINPPDRGGISLDVWQQRLKAITAEIRSAADALSKQTTNR